MRNLMNKILNIVAPPLACLTIWLTLTSFRTLKRFFSLFTFFFFTENVSGKVILITGASSGIGEQVAYEYARRGGCLVLVSRREDELSDVAVRCLRFGSPDVIFLAADASRVDDCKLAVDAAIAHFGNLDHLVNNAGITSVNMFEDCEDVTNLRPVMDINFWGSVYMTRYAIPHLRSSKGKITAIASATSWLPVPRTSFYNASKAAMLSFHEALRIELWPDVAVTIAAPGYIETEITQGKVMVPVGAVGGFAKAVVSGACQGKRLVIEPDWIGITRLWKILCPEALDWMFWWWFCVC